MLEKVDRLKILFVTDIHLNSSGIDKISQWADEHHNTQPRFDYCFIGGDTGNCHHDSNEHDEQEMLSKTLKVHAQLKNIFQCKTFFIPGNHDCKQFFIPNSQKEYDDFYNLHNRRVQLSEGLDVVGFGGSVPAYVNGELFWLGYPFMNQDDIAEQWSRAKKIETSQSKNQFIFLTHVGPSESSTAQDRKHLFPNDVVETGSSFLNQYFLKKELLCWLHGHSHQGSKLFKCGDIQVMNPGALKNNEFMYLELIKEEAKWKVGKKVFEIL